MNPIQFGGFAVNTEEAKKRIDELSDRINKYDYLYYIKNDPEIADENYDELRRELIKLERLYPRLKNPDSPSQRVGAPPVDKFDSINHIRPMLSLASTTSQEEIREFDSRMKRLAGKKRIKYTAEPKFDGLSIELVYENGLLSKGSTRGDGRTGEDISVNIKTISSVPLKLRVSAAVSVVSVRGEAIMLLEDFQKLNGRMIEAGASPFANPRNAAAGSLRQLDSKVTAGRPLTFYGYEIMYMEGESAPASHTKELELLEEWGFKVYSEYRLCENIDAAIDFHSTLSKKRDTLPFEIDGVVIKVNSKELTESAGARSRSPRWAIALKFKPRREITTVEDIVVQVGRTGKLTPVALLKPVDVSGVTVSRATLHNADEVAKKDIRIGDTVRIERAGDVIPAVVERIKTGKSRGPKFSMPAECPVCGSSIIREGAYHFCSGELSCPSQLKRSITHFASRGGMDIEHLGKKTAELMVEKGILSSVDEIFRLDYETVMTLEGFAEKSARNLLNAIEESKEISLSRFIFALGIRGVGEHAARLLARHFGSLERLEEASREDLLEIDEIGPGAAGNIRRFLSDEKKKKIIKSLLSSGVTPFIEREKDSSVFSGYTFVFTGALERFTRDQAKELVVSLGGRVSSSVSGKTDYLVAGGAPGSKYEKAVKLGVPIISEDEFEKLSRGV